MEISFQGQITKDYLTSIYYLDYKSQRWLTYVFGPLFVLFLGFFIFTTIKGSFNGYLLAIMIISGVMAGSPLWGPSTSAKRLYQNQPEMRGVFSGTINDDEISLSTINTTQKFKWVIYNKIVRNGSLVLLYQKNLRCFNFYPRSFFSSDEDWEAFISILDSKVQKGELEERTGRIDLTLGMNLPRWVVILFIVMIASPALCGLVALLLILIRKVAQ